MSKTAQLLIEDKKLDLPIIEGTENEKAIDITSLRSQTGYITLDDGYMNTGSCTSQITYIDGEKGILRYRGYAIEELAAKSGFMETSYLLLYGELPTREQLHGFEEDIKHHTLLDEGMKKLFDGFPRHSHPMAVLCGMCAALSAFYETEHGCPCAPGRSAIRLIAKMPTIIAWAYRHAIGRPYIYPDNSKSYIENFFHMMFAVPCEPYHTDPEIVRALDMLLVIHADHEQNCSTSAVRLARSALVNLYASIASGVCALWGPRHGGANEEVIRMLEEIRHEGLDVRSVVEQVKTSRRRLMGFGHRIYKNFDPRATLIKEQCDVVLRKLNRKDPLLDIAKELEDAALHDEYFIERKLYPNVDFYSGIIYRALGIPPTSFTSMFVLGRLPGWIAQALEYCSDPKNKIGRPRQIYTGAARRDYVPIDKRAA